MSPKDDHNGDSPSADHLFYAYTQIRPAGDVSLSDQYRFDLWQPNFFHIRPAGCGWANSLVWWLFHNTRIFRNHHYSVLRIFHGSEVVHRSCISPPYFRFPFMNQDDLMIGDTWTDPEERGKGLAAAALGYIAVQLQKPGRRLWYVTSRTNTPSIRAVEKVGFQLVGKGMRTRRWGVALLGDFRITETIGGEP